MTIDYLILPDDAQSARAALYAHHFLTHSDEDEGKTAVKSAEWNRSLLAHLSAKGGFSVYDYLGGAPTAGYMVCTDKSTEKTCTMAQVVARSINHRGILRQPYAGTAGVFWSMAAHTIGFGILRRFYP